VTPEYERELRDRTSAVFESYPGAHDHRNEHPWLAGALGDPGAPVWFIGELPSLRQVERARSPDGSAPTPEAQWWASPGDQLFRKMLVAHGFKDGTLDSPGGWRCYITNVIKEADYAGDWRRSSKERVRLTLDRWMPVLAWEIRHGAPRVVVALGDSVRRHLDYLATRGLRLPKRATIWSYVYVASRPDGKRGPMHPERVAEYSRQSRKFLRE
jgi:hypothetical protein